MFYSLLKIVATKVAVFFLFKFYLKYCDLDFYTNVVNVSAFIGKQELKVHPIRACLKPICEFIRKFKKHLQADFVNAMKETPFGPIFMTFYNEEFGAEKGLKSNISVLKL